MPAAVGPKSALVGRNKNFSHQVISSHLMTKARHYCNLLQLFLRSNTAFNFSALAETSSVKTWLSFGMSKVYSIGHSNKKQPCPTKLFRSV